MSVNNIVLSLTTVPNRLYEYNGCSVAKTALKTLLEQKYSPYSVHFNIPISYQNKEIEIPAWISEYQLKYSHFHVFRTKDYGSITKILPTLYRIEDPETLIIIADDDLYYADNLIQAHINGRNKYPDSAIGFAGLGSLDGSCHFCTTLYKDTKVKILEGYKTVSYLRKFFDLNEFTNNFVGKSWRDDEILSAYMGYKNISKIVLSYEKDDDFTPRVESFPVLGHIPAEYGGCYEFRNNLDLQNISEQNIQLFYKLGYLDR